MRLETIQKQENLNFVNTVGDIGPGGAYHRYNVGRLDKEYDAREAHLLGVIFQEGPRGNLNSMPGVMNEDLLEIVRHRLQCFQGGEFANEYNQEALEHIEKALEAMNRRVEDRIARNVLGTYNK